MRLSTDHLYKYRNFKNLDGSINTYTQNLLEYGEMFFAKPSQFEDVHDCEVKVFLAATNKAIRDFWKDELLQIDPNFENLLHRMGFWGNPQGFAKWYTKKFSKEKSTESENLSLYCLCNNSLQEAMWEKYATQEGVCIGFRTFCHMGSVGIKLKENIVYDDGKQKCKSTFIPFINVQYGKDNHAKVNRLPTSEFMENLKKALLTKDDYWSFESESRAFVYNM